MKNLQLSLINVWFQKTKTGEKTEDYREITPYWCNRFLLQNGRKETKDFWENYLEIYEEEILKSVLDTGDNIHRITTKEFGENIMTLGYPKKTDTERILKLEHKGIEISTGKTEWGAEENKLYFVLKHGSISHEA